MVERISPNPLTETANTESVGQFLLRIRQTALWSNLDENEQLVLESRHLEDLTLEKTAPQIGVSTKERVRQIEVNAWGIILHLLPQEEKSQILPLLPARKSVLVALQLDSRVEQLKQDGKSTREIAQELGVSRSIVNHSAHRLIKAGRIEAAPKGRPVSQTIIERDTKVEQLRKAGLKNARIAIELGVDLSTVARSASRLIKAGRIARAR